MCLKKIILAGTLAGVAAFAWSSISWMALPFHMNSLSKFTNENQAVESIDKLAADSGIYVAPSCCTKEKPKSKTFVFAAVTKNAPSPEESMGSSVGFWLLLNVIAFTVIAGLIAQLKSGVSYFKKVGLITLLGAASGLFIFADSIWWLFPLSFTTLTFIDHVVGFIVAGLIIAKFLPETPEETLA